MPISRAGSSAPRSDSDASCSAATQPSVLAVSSSTSLRSSSNPLRSTRKFSDSVVSKRSAVASISTSSSCIRIRLIGSPTWLRPVTTTVSPAQMLSSK